MSLSSEIKFAINHCIKYAIPFVTYRLPQCDAVFFADPDMSVAPKSHRSFVINKWNTSSEENVIIRDCYNALEITQFKTTDEICDKLPKSTNKIHYISAVTKFIETLKQRGGKTVVSRTQTGTKDNRNWADIADSAFEKFPKAFCHIYYTPQTGAWLGATPEVLLTSSDYKHFETMALAGTHPVGFEWDEKNKQEQQFVTDFIRESLTPLCDNLNIEEPVSLQYGNIEHLCSRIKGELLQESSLFDAVNLLSPTPAVAGTPRDKAINEINSIEQHDRGCYCGYVAVLQNDIFAAYVNLRCLKFNTNGDYCVFAGGGITPESTADSEWDETSAKIRALLSSMQL